MSAVIQRKTKTKRTRTNYATNYEVSIQMLSFTMLCCKNAKSQLAPGKLVGKSIAATLGLMSGFVRPGILQCPLQSQPKTCGKLLYPNCRDFALPVVVTWLTALVCCYHIKFTWVAGNTVWSHMAREIPQRWSIFANCYTQLLYFTSHYHTQVDNLAQHSM